MPDAQQQQAAAQQAAAQQQQAQQADQQQQQAAAQQQQKLATPKDKLVASLAGLKDEAKVAVIAGNLRNAIGAERAKAIGVEESVSDKSFVEVAVGDLRA